MIGEIVSHYRIVELLGAGGMGVVYKAEDLRLKRAVALKFLPVELTKDVEAKQRLMQEAQAASALDHPNICTIHEIDETPDGRLFLAMAYYDGETLKQRVARGPLAIDEAVDIASQIARGIAAAHEANIIHRDIKAANIILTRRGEAKILDFGLAKLVGQTALTRTGMTVGTVAYMAPEQIAGVEADARSDVWAIGVVLYEMLAGHLPFQADNDAAFLHAILNRAPRPLREVRAETPPELERVLTRALEKDPNARYASARELLQYLPARQAPSIGMTGAPTMPAVTPRAATSRRRALVAVVAIVVLVGLAAAWLLNRSRAVRSEKATALAEIKRLVAQDNYVAAFALARNAEAVLKEDPDFADLWPRISVTRQLKSDPPGAFVSVRDVAQRGDWQPVGRTPLDAVRFPAGMARWRFELPGFEPQEIVGIAAAPPAPPGPLSTGTLPPAVALLQSGAVPKGMLRIAAGPLAMILTGYDYNKTIASGEYLIDKFEVTNKEYKEFVDGGGYEKRQYWKPPFVKDGRTLSWDEAIRQFRDQTGRPGPSTWEVGTYRKGQDEYPVSGVSWYEAAAYAEFRGKSLPTVYHWIRAAGTGAGAYITPLSNFSANLLPVGRSLAVSPFGLFDVAGNVKEWCLNEMQAGSTRYILGGAINEPDYMFIYPDARSPFDRSDTNGIRLAKYPKPESLPAATMALVERPTRDYSKEQPVSDEVYRAYMTLYSYDPIPLAPAVERVDDSSELWRKEKVSFTSGYGKERVPAYLFLPKKAKPPFQAILYWPGSGAVRARSSETLWDLQVIDFLIMSGRALLYPVYHGTYERFDQRDSTWPEATRAYREWVMKQVNDARRGLDYLESRPDIRHDAIGYIGFSWGARMSSLVLAQEPRVRTAVLLSGGFSPGRAPGETDPFNFAPHVSIPLLMINGDHDFIFEVKLSQEPLLRTLGTPPDRKKHLVFEGGHGIIFEKRSQVIRETLDWLDRYLGPVH